MRELSPSEVARAGIEAGRHPSFAARTPDELQENLAELLGIDRANVLVIGDLARRTAVIATGSDQYIVASFHDPLHTQAILTAHPSIQIKEPGAPASLATIPENVIVRLKRPTVRLVSLCHPEVFPRPRFALAISNLAASIRGNFCGQVYLEDFQLDSDVTTAAANILCEKPDIVGISCTFGQQDLCDSMIDAIVGASGYSPLIIVGGSLAALNYRYLLERYPGVLVSRGPGEATMSALVRVWHGDTTLADVPHIAYVSGNGSAIVETSPSRKDGYIATTPELDLLPRTLAARGVMQLESSRGCTYSCSFCPRDHKGRWSGSPIPSIAEALAYVSQIFDLFPAISRKIFFVDEEFIGYRADLDGLARAKGVSEFLAREGFRFETSARMDQVYRSTENRDWHRERVAFWRDLVEKSLDRVLFGVESGVDSILKRFNKHITSAENTAGIRLLSAAGIPVRLTYITFDPLMSMDELVATYVYQGRRDLILSPMPSMGNGELFEAIHDPAFVAEHCAGQPLYYDIPYMLVSMESLLGSAYLKQVESLGLAGRYHWSMGRRDASYKEEAIGLMSTASQLWIDRTFALDYTLKSLLKVNSREVRELVIPIRLIVKTAAYRLLGSMLSVVTGSNELIGLEPTDEETVSNHRLVSLWGEADDLQKKITVLTLLLDAHFARLVGEVEASFSLVCDSLPLDDKRLLSDVIMQWRASQEWRLINVD